MSFFGEPEQTYETFGLAYVWSHLFIQSNSRLKPQGKLFPAHDFWEEPDVFPL